jgi:hypothetical protein
MKFKNTVAALAKVLGATFGNNEQLAFDNALQTELAAMDAEKELDDAERKAACDSYMKELGKDSLDDDETREAYRRAAADKRKANDSKPAQDAVAPPVVEPAHRSRSTRPRSRSRPARAIYWRPTRRSRSTPQSSPLAPRAPHLPRPCLLRVIA